MAKMITSGKLGTLVQGLAALGANATGEAVRRMIEEPLDYMTRHISLRHPGQQGILPDGTRFPMRIWYATPSRLASGGVAIGNRARRAFCSSPTERK